MERLLEIFENANSFSQIQIGDNFYPSISDQDSGAQIVFKQETIAQ